MFLLKPIAAVVGLVLANSLASPTPAAISTVPIQDPATAFPSMSPVANDPQPVTFEPTESNNECGVSSFVDQTSGTSPKVEDCLHIAENIKDGGTWQIENIIAVQHQLVEWGTCAFGVQGDRGNGGYFFVGNQYIIDIIHVSIEKFGRNGVVGSKGDMFCNSGAPLRPLIEWGLYHTK